MDSYVVTARFIVLAPDRDTARLFVAGDVIACVEADQAIPATDPFAGVGYRHACVDDDVHPLPVNHTLYLPFERQAD